MNSVDAGIRGHAARAVLCALLLTGWPAFAQSPPGAPALTMDQALAAARAAVRKCASDGYAVSAAVVDLSGVVKAQLRADGAGVHTTDSSRRKAYTAASIGVATGELARMIAEKPQLQGLRDMNDDILILGGGLPIRIAGRLVGGIGVGGAPSAGFDEACAKAGLAATDGASGGD